MSDTNWDASRNEDEYFLKQDAELLKKKREELDAKRRKQERSSHLNKCPKDGSELQEREYHHVKIDSCAECGGIWLDKGELEMLTHTERSAIGRMFGDMLGIKRP